MLRHPPSPFPRLTRGGGQAAAKAAKVTICHFPPDNPSNGQTTTVNANALAGHLVHGDILGQCPPPPLRTWCFSPAQDFCFSVFTFEFSASVLPTGNTFTSWSMSGVWFGPGFSTTNNPTWRAFLNLPFSTRTFNARMSDFPAQEVLVPGELASVSRSISFTPGIGTLTRDATLDDVASLVLLDDGAFQDSCITNNPTNSAACFEIAGGQPKVQVCHRIGNGTWNLITVGQPTLAAHKAHGDAEPGEAVPGSGDTQVFGPSCQVLPVPAFPLASIEAGNASACGLTPSGVAYCWGANNSGQLGDGTTTFPRSVPVAVSGGLTFTTLGLGHGGEHTCGLVGSGAAYCWGLNNGGSLGDGSQTMRLTPVAVSGGLEFNELAVGANHTCGLVRGGAAYCWGLNNFGSLGDGSRTKRLTPVAVSGGLTFKAISAGTFFTCGLRHSGAAHCWGNNFAGQLGDNSPVADDAFRPTPGPVAGGLRFTALSVGAEHVCGLAVGGAAYCWGNNSQGGLGDGTTMRRSAPVAVEGGLTFTAVSAGTSFTCWFGGRG